ncbi:MAG: MarR family transcriptional regulator [Roseiarcus sp.]|jgi:DNA-binding MarR family transcriptional regulator
MPEPRYNVDMSETTPIDPSVYEGLAAFRLALRRFLAFSEAATGAAGVTTQQYQALLVVKTHPAGALMIREFADQMLLQHHGAVQMIDRLVAGGLVQRSHSPTDGRSVLVSLTVKGAALLERLASQHVKELLKQEPLLAESLKRLRQIGRAQHADAPNRLRD